MSKYRSAIARDLRTPKYRKRIISDKRRKDPKYDTLEEYHDYKPKYEWDYWDEPPYERQMDQ